MISAAGLATNQVSMVSHCEVDTRLLWPTAVFWTLNVWVSLRQVDTKWVTTPETYLHTCAPYEDSDQHAYSRSLIRIFTVRILDGQNAFNSCGQRKLIRLRRYTDLHDTLFGAHVRRYVAVHISVLATAMKTSVPTRHQTFVVSYN